MGRRARVISSPEEPTRKLREGRAMTHTPYQPCCAHCVRGKGREAMHRRSPQEPREILLEEMDYTLLKVHEQETKTQFLVVKDMESKACLRHRAARKYRVVLKSDAGPEVREVKDKIRRKWEFRPVIENIPVKEPKANRFMETATGSPREKFRTLKDALETRVGEKVPIGWAVHPCLVECSATLPKRYALGKDGKTACERIRGKQSARQVAGFGEFIWKNSLRNAPYRSSENQTQWGDGLCLGVDARTDEATVGNGDGMIRTRTVKRRTPS